MCGSSSFVGADVGYDVDKIGVRFKHCKGNSLVSDLCFAGPTC